MTESAVTRALNLAEIWELLADAIDPPDLAGLRLVCRRANEAAARRDFRWLTFKLSRNAYAPGRLRKIRSLVHVRHLVLQHPSVLNLKRLMATMAALASGDGLGGHGLQTVDLRISALHMPAFLDACRLHPLLRNRMRSLHIDGQQIDDYGAWNDSDAVDRWNAITDLLSMAGEDDAMVPLTHFMVAPDDGGRGIYWPDQMTNGPHKRFYEVLGQTIAPHLEVFAAGIGRSDLGDGPHTVNADTFLALTSIAWPKLRRLLLHLTSVAFTELQKQDFDALLLNAPELVELDLSASTSFPLRLRTRLPKLRHLRILLNTDAGNFEHAEAVRAEVAAFIELHCAELVSLHLEVRKAGPRGMMLFMPGGGLGGPAPPRHPCLEPIDVNVALFPRLRAISGPFNFIGSQRASWYDAAIDAGEGSTERSKANAVDKPQHAAQSHPDDNPNIQADDVGMAERDELESWEDGRQAWQDLFVEENKRNDLGRVTKLKVQCTEPRQIEHGLRVLAHMFESGTIGTSRSDGARLREVHLCERLSAQSYQRQYGAPEPRRTIWRWLRALARLRGGVEVVRLWQGYGERTLLGPREREARFAGAELERAVPPGLRFVVENGDWYRLVRSVETSLDPGIEGVAEGQEIVIVRLEPVHPRHLASTHRFDARPDYRLERLIAGSSAGNSGKDLSLMEHLDVSEPILLGYHET